MSLAVVQTQSSSSLLPLRRFGQWPRVVLVCACIGSALCGIWFGAVQHIATRPPEAALARLMAFMAAIKIATALAAVCVTFWRLGPASGLQFGWRFALAASIASALMAAGAALIGFGQSTGALVFHGGFLLFLALCWQDTRAKPA